MQSVTAMAPEPSPLTGAAADSVTISLANTFCHAFGSPNLFNVLSLECTDRGTVAQRVLGNENLILQPDAARARFVLLLSTNPLVTNGMTLLQRRPRIAADLKAIQYGGGKVVVVDPRDTETARVADVPAHGRGHAGIRRRGHRVP